MPSKNMVEVSNSYTDVAPMLLHLLGVVEVLEGAGKGALEEQEHLRCYGGKVDITRSL